MAEMKSAHEWLKDPRVQDRPDRPFRIMDPDGWRRSDGVTLDDPISLQDFQERLMRSTIIAE